MSTTMLIGRTPADRNRAVIQAGGRVILLTPLIRRPTKRRHPSKASIVVSFDAIGGRSDGTAGGFNGTPKMALTSRAIPRWQRRSGRFDLISSAKIVSAG